MYVLSSADTSLDKLVKSFYASLKCQLTNLFVKYHINIALTIVIQKKFHDHSIYNKLHATDLIVKRTLDNMNTFYLMDRADYNKRAQLYITISDDYSLLISTRSSQVNSADEKQTKI